jgi:hypothetical protein
VRALTDGRFTMHDAGETGMEPRFGPTAVLQIGDIRLALRSNPQTNGICERFHKTLLDEFYRVALHKKVYDASEPLQADLDAWMDSYNTQRTHQGRWCLGKTLMQTFLDGHAP